MYKEELKEDVIQLIDNMNINELKCLKKDLIKQTDNIECVHKFVFLEEKGCHLAPPKNINYSSKFYDEECEKAFIKRDVSHFLLDY